MTIQQEGSGTFTETIVGTFAFDYLDQNGNPDNDSDAVGNFTEWDGGTGLFDQNGNPIGKGEESSTLNGRGTNVDSGASFSFHNNSHAVFDSFGNPKLAFSNSHCG
jgi:hypothetical protein